MIASYKCKHEVQAARWVDTDANREALSDWFEEHGAIFGTCGSVVVLPEEGEVREGDWIVLSDGVFFAMEDDAFQVTYRLA